MILSRDAIRAALLDLAVRRGAQKSFCPSEVAHGLSNDWRPLTPEVRAVARELVEKRMLIATQMAQPFDPALVRGPIRLGRPPFSA